MRLGRPGPIGSGAFGTIHYTTDHNLSDDAVAAVIANNAAPIVREDGRHVYGLRGIALNRTLITIEVVVDPRPTNVDGFAFGVVTAYCIGPTVCPEGDDAAIEASKLCMLISEDLGAGCSIVTSLGGPGGHDE